MFAVYSKIEQLIYNATIDPSGMAAAQSLNSVAYQLGGAGMITEAIEVLNTAIQLYPQEANPYDKNRLSQSIQQK